MARAAIRIVRAPTRTSALPAARLRPISRPAEADCGKRREADAGGQISRVPSSCRSIDASDDADDCECDADPLRRAVDGRRGEPVRDRDDGRRPSHDRPTCPSYRRTARGRTPRSPRGRWRRRTRPDANWICRGVRPLRRGPRRRSRPRDAAHLGPSADASAYRHAPRPERPRRSPRRPTRGSRPARARGCSIADGPGCGDRVE